MKFKSNFKISSPATIANIACGFGILGIAIEALSDEIIVRPTDKAGIHISTILKNKTKIPTSIEENAAGKSAQLLLDFLKKERGLDPNLGLDFEIIKKIPVGYGIGSSSASAVAGAMAVNEAFGVPLSKRNLLPFVAQGEHIAENGFRINSIVPALLGGLILVRDHASFDFHRLPFPKGLHIVVVYPRDKILLHKQVRNNLSKKVSLEKTIHQLADVGAFVHALYTSDLDLLSRSLEDFIAEEHWSSLIPFFREVKEAALSQNALGCSIAGTGSGIFAICKNSLEAEQAAQAMQAIYTANNIRSASIVSKINLNGAKVE